MSELPKGWTNTKIGDLVDSIVDGPYGSKLKSSHYTIGGARVIRLGNIGRGEYLPAKEAFISLSYFRELANHHLIEGDLVVAALGDPLGRCCEIPASALPALVKADCFRLRLGEGVYKRLFVYWMNSQNVSALLSEQAHGVGRLRINLSDLRSTVLPIPPVAEQKRIVARLDALSAKSARARTELARIETLVSRYKQAVLSKAFSGELTWSYEGGNSAALFDKDSEVTQLWSVPQTWSWCRTDQIGRVGLGRQRSPKNHEGPQMHPYLRSANITWAGVDTSDVKEMNFDDADFKRFKLEVGDVLLNEGSGSAKEVGKPAIWRGEIADCCYQNTLLRVQPRRCSSEYAYYYFLLTARAGRFVSSTQGVNIQHIGREGLACYPFPLAPEPEQHEIVRRIESAFAKIDRLEKEAKRALELVGRLDNTILAKAFRGELVSQDENDEPASLLLDRIREARAGVPSRPKRRTSATKGKVHDMARTIIEALAEAKDWLAAQELFARCGIRDGSSTEDVEKLYRQLLDLERQDKVEIEDVSDPLTGEKQGNRVRLRK